MAWTATQPSSSRRLTCEASTCQRKVQHKIFGRTVIGRIRAKEGPAPIPKNHQNLDNLDGPLD
jgi:hypothetical protein